MRSMSKYGLETLDTNMYRSSGDKSPVPLARTGSFRSTLMSAPISPPVGMEGEAKALRAQMDKDARNWLASPPSTPKSSASKFDRSDLVSLSLSSPALTTASDLGTSQSSARHSTFFSSGSLPPVASFSPPPLSAPPSPPVLRQLSSPADEVSISDVQVQVASDAATSSQRSGPASSKPFIPSLNLSAHNLDERPILTGSPSPSSSQSPFPEASRSTPSSPRSFLRRMVSAPSLSPQQQLQLQQGELSPRKIVSLKAIHSGIASMNTAARGEEVTSPSSPRQSPRTLPGAGALRSDVRNGTVGSIRDVSAILEELRTQKQEKLELITELQQIVTQFTEEKVDWDQDDLASQISMQLRHALIRVKDARVALEKERDAARDGATEARALAKVTAEKIETVEKENAALTQRLTEAETKIHETIEQLEKFRLDSIAEMSKVQLTADNAVRVAEERAKRAEQKAEEEAAKCRCNIM